MTKYPDAICLFYDSEFGITPAYLRAMGVDPDRVVHTPVQSVEQLKIDMVNQLEEIERGEKVIVFIDSIGNLASKKETEDALNEKSVADMTRAKSLKSLFRIVTPYFSIKNIPCVAVNHTIETIEMFSKTVMTGGTGPMFRLQNGSLYGCYNNYFTFTPTIGTWYHIACTRSGGIEKTYVNGVLMKTYSGSTASHTSAVLRVGEVWDSSSAYNFNGYIDELRIEKGICRSAEEIRQAYEVGKRMHPVIVEFGTNPSSAYTAGATTMALSSVSGLNIGDTMIVSESVASGTNIEERVVTNISGTTVTLASGFSNSYSTSSRVFKWQEEFMDTTAPLGTHKDSTTRMTFLVTNGTDGRNVWIDDIKTSSGYLSAPSSTQNVTSGLKRFLQFRAIFTRSDTSINPYVTNVLLDWSGAGGPTLDQLMRHGQSFLNQVRQTFYFINIRSILGF
jgi:hypothetical protein